MSRVGKKPIAVPSGVEFSVKDNVVTVKGPKGTLTKEFNNNITIKLEDGHITVERPNDEDVYKRQGMRLYKTQAKKKAIVKLAKENTITYFKEV